MISTAPSPDVKELKLSANLEKVLAGEQIITSVLGVDQRITRTYSFDQSVDFLTDSSFGGTSELNVGVISAKATAEIENRRGIQLSKTQSVTKEITVSGAVQGRK